MANFKKLYSDYFNDATIFVTTNTLVTTAMLKVIVDATLANVTITLHDPSLVPGKELTISRLDATIPNKVIVTGPGFDDFNISNDGKITIFARGSQWLFKSEYKANGSLFFRPEDIITSLGENGDLSGQGVLDGVPAYKLINSLIANLPNGITRVIGVPNFQLLTAFSATEIKVAAGEGQIITRSPEGTYGINYVSWVEQIISPSVDFGFFDGNFTVDMGDDGQAVMFDNQGSSFQTPQQYAGNTLGMGNVTVVSGFLTGVFMGYFPIGSVSTQLYTVNSYLGTFSNVGELGFDVSPTTIGTGLQVQLSAGSNFYRSGGSIVDYKVPNILGFGTIIDPVTLIGVADPISGNFFFSPTAEIDPTKLSRSGITTAISNSGGSAQFTSAGHLMFIGDPITVYNNPYYSGTFTITARSANTFTLNTPFIVGSDVAPFGTWSGLTPVTGGDFTLQRLLAFGQIPIIGAFYGKDKYATILQLDDRNAESSERFNEPPIGAGGAKCNLLIVQSTATNWTNPLQFQFRKPSSRLK